MSNLPLTNGGNNLFEPLLTQNVSIFFQILPPIKISASTSAILLGPILLVIKAKKIFVWPT